MKKPIALVLSLVLCFAFAACTQVPEKQTVPDEADTKTNDSGNVSGLPNPMTEMTEEEFNSEFNTAVWVPEGSEDVHFFKIEAGDLKIAQVDYTRFDNEYCYRFAKGDEQDISGMYYTWTYDTENDSSGVYKPACHMRINEDEGVGACTWYDSRTGTNYSITMSEGATRDKLISTFDTIFGYYCAVYGEEDVTE
ncbi:MAG: hypothetical protein II473_04475 [Clostridia bacterium]|nr:hypothetical protein [Clostridia bacterium]